MNTRKFIETALGKQKAELVIKNARYLNVFSGEVLRGDIAVSDGMIVGIGEYEGQKTYFTDGLVVPAFIDGHVHIESSLVTPEMFSFEALRHGTTTVVCDPHEIANVAGIDGIKFMMNSAKRGVIDFKFMLPSCVPATQLDLNYCTLHSADLRPLYKNRDVIGLAEVMDVNKVLSGDLDMLIKIADGRKHGVVDGHAPLLSQKELCAYTMAGITSDHECTTLKEATEKLRLGQYVMIREGTAAKNLSALVSLINKYPYRCMLVTDDLHPDYLTEKGHIDSIVRKAIELGADQIKALICAAFTPAVRFGLKDRGAIAPFYRADLAVWDGEKVIDVFCAKKRKDVPAKALSVKIDAPHIDASDIVPTDDVITLVKNELITTDGGVGDAILFTLERHKGTGKAASCLLGGYGIRKGAVATSIAHDSHNIVAAGADRASIALAVNSLIDMGGGIVVTDGSETMRFPLEIGGIMTARSVPEAARRLTSIKNFAYTLGIESGVDPFMSLSFLSLPVIPSIRLLPSGVVRI